MNPFYQNRALIDDLYIHLNIFDLIFYPQVVGSQKSLMGANTSHHPPSLKQKSVLICYYDCLTVFFYV